MARPDSCVHTAPFFSSKWNCCSCIWQSVWYLILKVLTMLVCVGVSGKLLYKWSISVLYSYVFSLFMAVFCQLLPPPEMGHWLFGNVKHVLQQNTDFSLAVFLGFFMPERLQFLLRAQMWLAVGTTSLKILRPSSNDICSYLLAWVFVLIMLISKL